MGGNRINFKQTNLKLKITVWLKMYQEMIAKGYVDDSKIDCELQNTTVHCKRIVNRELYLNTVVLVFS